VTASKGYVLLRLKPGPAESLFGITAAPNAAVADWHGRVTVSDLNLRGDVAGACARLLDVLREFDFKAATQPPFSVPIWAKALVTASGAEAMAAFLESEPKAIEKLGKLLRSLDREGELIYFCDNYFAACEARTPTGGAAYPGYSAEVALVEEMTWCRNDRIKFNAIACYGRFAPLSGIAFLIERADERAKECRNPNIILCNAMTAIGDMAARFPGVSDPRTALERKMIVKTLPALVAVLDGEGRNNGACRNASRSIEIIAEKTGAPEALEAYIHNFNAPPCHSQWMIDYTARYCERALPWLRERTGLDLDADYDAWCRWFRKNKDDLFFDSERKMFVVNAKAARDFRKKLAGW
jgi:hypothetical protein